MGYTIITKLCLGEEIMAEAEIGLDQVEKPKKKKLGKGALAAIIVASVLVGIILIAVIVLAILSGSAPKYTLTDDVFTESGFQSPIPKDRNIDFTYSEEDIATLMSSNKSDAEKVLELLKISDANYDDVSGKTWFVNTLTEINMRQYKNNTFQNAKKGEFKVEQYSTYIAANDGNGKEMSQIASGMYSIKTMLGSMLDGTIQNFAKYCVRDYYEDIKDKNGNTKYQMYIHGEGGRANSFNDLEKIAGANVNWNVPQNSGYVKKYSAPVADNRTNFNDIFDVKTGKFNTDDIRVSGEAGLNILTEFNAIGGDPALDYAHASGKIMVADPLGVEGTNNKLGYYYTKGEDLHYVKAQTAWNAFVDKKENAFNKNTTDPYMWDEHKQRYVDFRRDGSWSTGEKTPYGPGANAPEGFPQDGGAVGQTGGRMYPISGGGDNVENGVWVSEHVINEEILTHEDTTLSIEKRNAEEKKEGSTEEPTQYDQDFYRIKIEVLDPEMANLVCRYVAASLIADTKDFIAGYDLRYTKYVAEIDIWANGLMKKWKRAETYHARGEIVNILKNFQSGEDGATNNSTQVFSYDPADFNLDEITGLDKWNQYKENPKADDAMQAKKESILTWKGFGKRHDKLMKGARG